MFLSDDGQLHTKKVSSSVDDYSRAIVDGLAGAFAETGLVGGKPGRDPPWHHGRLERHPGTQRSAHRPHRQQGVPRHSRHPHLADAAALRFALGEAASPDRALSAHHRRRAHRRPGAHPESARSRRCRARGQAAAGRGRRGDRDLPAQLLRQSRPRAPHPGDRRASCAGADGVHQLRSAAGNQGVRAHLDHGDQRLSQAGSRPLPALAARQSRSLQRQCAGPPDAVERRADHGPCGGRAADPHRRVGTCRRRHRIADRRPRHGTVARHFVRHGRHDRQGLAHRGGRGHARARMRGGRRRNHQLAAADRRRLHAEGAGDRSRRSRRRRRLGDLARRGRLDAGRAGERRRLARAGLLRPGRHGAHHHRRERRARLHQSALPGRRRAHAQLCQGAQIDRRASRGGWT